MIKVSQIYFSDSARLFVAPGFINGAARALDLGSTFDVYCESVDSDRAALMSDWTQVGNDIAGAINKYAQAE